MKVRVSSYQSIASAEVEVQGFTAITGSSNIGKSALLRAIAGALFGQEGDHYVRKGLNSCAVTVEHDGHHIEWAKARKKTATQETCLILDGVKHTRMGKGHGELTAPLGFASIKAGGEQLRPQYARQHDDIFLLTATPNAAAEVFRQLGRADVVARAQTLAKADFRKADAERAVRERDQEAAFEAACELGWVPLLEEDLRQTQSQIRDCEAGMAERRGVLERVEALRSLGDPVELPELPELPDPGPLEALLGQVRERLDLEPREVPGVPELPVLGEQTVLLGLIDEYERAGAALADASRNVGNADADLESLRGQKLELEAELGTCPTCGTPFTEAGP